MISIAYTTTTATFIQPLFEPHFLPKKYIFELCIDGKCIIENNDFLFIYM